MTAYGSGTYGSGVYGGGPSRVLGQVAETDVAQPITPFGPAPFGALQFPHLYLECAFGVDPGQYPSCYQPVARSMLPAQYLRLQEGGAGTFVDNSRRANDGTGGGTITRQRPSPISDPSAFSADMAAFAHIDASVPQLANAPAITIIAWFKYTGTNWVLFGQPSWNIYTTGGFIGINTTGSDLYGAVAPSTGAWHLFTLTVFPNNTLDAYITIDGVLVDVQQRIGTPTFANITFSNTVVWGGASNPVAISLAEPMVMPFAVSLERIQSLWQARAEGAVPSTDPETFAWTNLTARMREAAPTRGRNSELDRVETGQCSVVVDNTDRALEPEFTGSPYYPNVVPYRPMRLRASYKAPITYLYSGYVYDWDMRWPSYRRGEVAFGLVDATEALMKDEIEVAFVQQLAGARVHEILDAAGWPLDQRDIATGISTCGARSLVGQPTAPIDELNTVAESEGGYFFIARNGKATFHDRVTRQNPPYNTSLVAFGDAGEENGELPYVSVKPDYSPDKVRNLISVSRTDPVTGDTSTATAMDWASRKKFRTRKLSITSVAANDAELQPRADAELARYKDPQQRFVGMSVEPRRAPTYMFPTVLTLDIAFQVTIVRRPQGGAPLAKAVYLESLGHNIVARERELSWSTSYALSPGVAIFVPVYWILGTSTLGTDTVLGF